MDYNKSDSGYSKSRQWIIINQTVDIKSEGGFIINEWVSIINQTIDESITCN